MHTGAHQEGRSKEKHIQPLPEASGCTITMDMPTLRSQTQEVYETQQLQFQPQPQPSKKVFEAFVKLLSELRIRSMIGSYMMYKQSDRYNQLAFWMLIVVSVLMGVATAILSMYIPVGKGWLQECSKIIIGAITVTFSTFIAGNTFLVEKFEKKQELFNKTGAKWQELELKIHLFLETADDTLTRESYEQFAMNCIQERTTICCLSKPEPDIYKKYNAESRHILESYLKKSSVITEIQDALNNPEDHQALSPEENGDVGSSFLQRIDAGLQN
ncbi:uncharacterized protein LOC124280651 [Haliotis rubra]|uniref:uncharacterized protein LOC124280651 n=1 Tax=Haliotis rubra TaxID=36100 RepID=UPI001EE4FF20|nr:uncharacterized protein LOC124280651 [Haliotis rubra]